MYKRQIKGVHEDLIEIILNLKQIRFSLMDEEKVTVSLKKTGKGEVTAKDIKTVSGVEIANPELVIAHLDNSKSKIEIDLQVEKGRGYVAVESRAGDQLPVGMIAIDAIYLSLIHI